MLSAASEHDGTVLTSTQSERHRIYLQRLRLPKGSYRNQVAIKCCRCPYPQKEKGHYPKTTLSGTILTQW